MKKLFLTISVLAVSFAWLFSQGDTTITIELPILPDFPAKGEAGWLEYAPIFAQWFTTFLGFFTQVLLVLALILRQLPTKTNVDIFYRIARWLDSASGIIGAIVKNRAKGGAKHKVESKEE